MNSSLHRAVVSAIGIHAPQFLKALQEQSMILPRSGKVMDGAIPKVVVGVQSRRDLLIPKEASRIARCVYCLMLEMRTCDF